MSEIPKGSESKVPVEQQPRKSASERYMETVDLLANFTKRRGPENAKNISGLFFDALSLLPEVVEEQSKIMAHPYKTQVYAHEEARELYMDALKAVEMQGRDVEDNEVVRLVASQGLVTETQALIDLKARRKEVFPK